MPDPFSAMDATDMAEVDTPEFEEGKPVVRDRLFYDSLIQSELWYPRQPGRKDKIQIGLIDVRAANDIVVMYDFKRDGWVILSDFTDPRSVDEYTEEEWDALPDVEGQPGYKNLIPKTLEEVAFIPSWPRKEETNETQ